MKANAKPVEVLARISALSKVVVGEFRKRPEFLSFFGLIPSVHARYFHSLSARESYRMQIANDAKLATNATDHCTLLHAGKGALRLSSLARF
jgi:hypothetical protein